MATKNSDPVEPEKHDFIPGYQEAEHHEEHPLIAPPRQNSLKKFLGSSRLYLVELVLAMVLLGTILVVNALLLQNILDHFAGTVDSTLSDYRLSMTIGGIATLLVSLPLFGIFYARTRASEAENGLQLQRSWRNILVGFFVVVWTLIAFGATVALVYAILARISAYGLEIDTSPWWQPVTLNLFLIVSYLAAAVVFARPWRVNGREKWSYWATVGITLGSVAILVMQVLPIGGQRNSLIDSKISQDLLSISYKVENYLSDNDKIPENLNSLGLSAEEKSRATSYNYQIKEGSDSGTYELCADFLTNTKDKKPQSDDPISAYAEDASLSYPSISGRRDDPNVHGVGRQCFEFTSYGIDPVYPLAPELDVSPSRELN